MLKRRLVLQTETIKDLQRAAVVAGEGKSTLVSYGCPPPTQVFTTCVNYCPLKK